MVVVAYFFSIAKSAMLIKWISLAVRNVDKCDLEIVELISHCNQEQPNQSAIHFVLKNSDKKNLKLKKKL